MAIDQKLQRELEAGAQPHCDIRRKPRNYRVYAAVLGVFLFAFGVTTGVAVSQQLPISQALSSETISNYLSKTFGSDFLDKFRGGQEASKSDEAITELAPEDDSSSKATTGSKQAVSSTIWQPAIGSTWNYQLYTPPTDSQMKNPSKYQVWGIDLFDTNTSTIKAIQASGSKVVCYFSGGSYEPNRNDSSKFQASDMGSALGGWPGEYWLKYNSQNVRSIMQARLDIAKLKGCNGVDPDNMDAYNNDNGWGATQQDTIDYITFLSTQAANRGLAIGLKNSLEVVSDSVVGMVQYSINEACSQYNECTTLTPFKTAGKPVFNVEYPKGDTINTNSVTGTKKNKACSDPTSGGITKIIKNRNLDDWIQLC